MEHVNTLEKVPEQLKCPICLEIPDAAVFQCSNGHMLCEKCQNKLSKCPQCRVEFGRQPVRLRVIENMLDELKLECSYKESGCKTILRRDIFSQHCETRFYNIAKYGPFVKVCQNLGYQNCNFQMNRGNTTEAIVHFGEVHSANVFKSQKCQFEFPSFSQIYSETYSGSTSTSLEAKVEDRNQEVIDGSVDPANSHRPLYPIILDSDAGSLNNFAFLIMVICNDDKTLSWVPLFWEHPSCDVDLSKPASCPYQVSCCLKWTNSLTWTISPIHILDVGVGQPFPKLFTMPIAPFQEFQDQTSGSIKAELKITQVENEDNASQEEELSEDEDDDDPAYEARGVPEDDNEYDNVYDDTYGNDYEGVEESEDEDYWN